VRCDPALILLMGAAVVIAAIVAARISHQTGLPGPAGLQ
jgi:hypothetical protein